ncbi:MAG TPA: TlpA disulfide reductase family protein [Mycobacteriales bacterium]|nr:TlpA disulfide reductase family protein [Mycobacteriales bacterium]
MPFRLRHAPRAAALVVALTALSACSGTNAVTQSVAGSSGFQAGDNSLTWLAPGHRPRPDAVSGKLLDGTPFDLASWRGHVVVVNFWGSWCAPCRDEAAALEQVYRDDRGKGVEFLGIDTRNDNIPSAESFLRNHHVTYPSLFDPSNVLALRFPGVPPSAIPTTLILDRQGRIAARHSGSILYTQLRDVVARALAEKT